ncbi:MAG: DNA alkylation repair protein [Flavobacteriales bacterium]|nr:DNA alkylation repair protein [Flavobacteriales bacterium]
MPENFQLKNIFNKQLVTKIGTDIIVNYRQFEKDSFVTEVVKNLEPLSLSERANLIMDTLHNYLPESFPEAIKIIVNSFGKEIGSSGIEGYDSLLYMPYGNYISKYGVDYFDLSMHAMYEITKRFTAEFPIRTFIEKYPKKTMDLLHKWVKDDNQHIRRLVSEGTRPRLPWASRLPEFQKNPKPVLELLEKLKEDPELYVRRSVANNLNDIAKDHPDLVVKTLKAWSKSKNKGTNWIIGHATRSLIKSGHTDALILLGYDPNVKVEFSNFIVDKSVKTGEELKFSFDLISNESKPVNLMIDYIIHFVKANGKQAPKVFKLAKKKLEKGKALNLKKKQSFKPISTRVYYPGMHAVELQINGRSYGIREFELAN